MPNNPIKSMPSLVKIDALKIQQIFSTLKESSPFDLITLYHKLEQEAQSNKESVLWSPSFREYIVSAFPENSDVSSTVEKLYLEILNKLYDAQEDIRDIIRKAKSDILDEASSVLGI